MSGLARTLSKLGYCSRRVATELIRAGRVRINGVTRRDPEFPVQLPRDQLQVDQQPIAAAERVYLMLNKPRGLVTSAADELGRDTVYQCFNDQFAHAHLSAVGRLDKASEGLLLFTNDTQWANTITAPECHLGKIYHVQVNQSLTPDDLLKIQRPVMDAGEKLAVSSAKLLRQGEKTTWVEFTLHEGRNRHLRRICEAHRWEVLRLIRIQIGSLKLGELTKGNWRLLTPAEVRQLAPASGSRPKKR